MHVTILGGGGFRVPLIARQLAASGLPVSRLVLYDTDPRRLAVIAGVLGGDPQTAALPVTAVGDLDAALRGADVIFSALRPGGLDGRVRDERTALGLGVLGQETVGAGGLASAARTVPVVAAIARRIAALAPDAWVISMTNPAGIVTEVMAAVLGPRVIGVCDSPVGLIRRACVAAGADPGPSLSGVTDRVDADYLGINHLGWLRGLRVIGTPGLAGNAGLAGTSRLAGTSGTSGTSGAAGLAEPAGGGTAGPDGDSGPDLLPGLLNDPERLATTDEGRLFGPDVLRSLGAIPNEYLYWYYANSEALRDVQAAGRTRGEHVRDRQLAFYAAATVVLREGVLREGALREGALREESLGEESRHEPPLPGTPGHATNGPSAARLWDAANDERNRSYFAELRAGERAGDRDEADVAAGGYESVAIALASALAGGPPARLILNVRNGDTVPALGPDTVIEVPCRVDAAGPVTLPVSPPSAHELGLMSVVRASERDIAEAALLAARAATAGGAASADEAASAAGAGAEAAAQASALALRAFATHPLVGSLDAARSLAATVLAPAPP